MGIEYEECPIYTRQLDIGTSGAYLCQLRGLVIWVGIGSRGGDLLTPITVCCESPQRSWFGNLRCL